MEEVITDFYLMIRNPVLLNTEIEFSPTFVSEIYPKVLPNLYKGQQMILVGRYPESFDLTTTLRGTSFSNNVEFSYTIKLSDSLNINFQFLTKLWAKAKMDDLLDQYRLNQNNTELAEDIKNEIIQLSLDYGVMSPFTSFQGDPGWDPGWDPGGINPVGIEWDYIEPDQEKATSLSNIYLKVEKIAPNPCRDHLNIEIRSKESVDGVLTFRIADAKGQIIYSSERKVSANSINQYHIDLLESKADKGVYHLLIEYKDKTIAVKFIII